MDRETNTSRVHSIICNECNWYFSWST